VENALAPPVLPIVLVSALIPRPISITAVLALKNAPPDKFAPIASAFSIAPPDKLLVQALASTSPMTSIIAEAAALNALAVNYVPAVNAHVLPASPIALVSASIPIVTSIIVVAAPKRVHLDKSALTAYAYSLAPLDKPLVLAFVLT
jgi:hypothetical protein